MIGGRHQKNFKKQDNSEMENMIGTPTLNNNLQFYPQKEENYERYEFENTPNRQKSNNKSQSQAISSNRACNSFSKPEFFGIEEKNNLGMTTPSKKPKFNTDFEIGGRKTIEKSIEKFTINKYLNSPKMCKFEESPSRFISFFEKFDYYLRMLNLCTPEVPARKYFLGTSSSRKQKNLSIRKMNVNMAINIEKENENPNINTPNYNENNLDKK